MLGVCVLGVCVCWECVPAKDIYQLESKLLVFKEERREIAQDLREGKQFCWSKCCFKVLYHSLRNL